MKRIITKRSINDFKKHLHNEEKSSATIEKYIRDITAFFIWTADREFGKSDVIAYKEHIIKNYSSASVNSMLSSLNSFFVFREWYECKVKTLKCQKRLFAREDRELTKTEYKRLLTAAKNKKNKRLYYIMQTICSSGIRISELRFITVDALRAKKAEVRSKGKERTVLLPQELCKMLKKYALQQNITHGCIFVSKNGKPLDRSNIWAEMKKLCKSANVEASKVFPHNLRHLFARTFYSQQKDIVRLADLLGHSSINTTRIYTMECGLIHRRKLQKMGLVYLRL